MKLASKLAASLALLGAFTTARAESITFGVNIPPVASLEVRDGVLLAVSNLRQLTTVLPGAMPTVGGFTVITNMPKWNLQFALANNGNLINASGNYLKESVATGHYLPLGVANNAAVTPGNVFIQFPAANQINGNDGAATPLTVTATAATGDIIAADGKVNNATFNTLTSVLHAASGNTCTTAQCADNGWIFGTDATTATFNIGTFIDNTNPVAGLAGTYTETMYITLLTSY